MKQIKISLSEIIEEASEAEGRLSAESESISLDLAKHFDIDRLSLADQDKFWHIEHLKDRSYRYKANTKLREWLAKWAVTIVTIWLFLVLAILSLNDGRISDSVMIALLGTTTLNVLGLTYIVLKGYFGSEEKDN